MNIDDLDTLPTREPLHRSVKHIRREMLKSRKKHALGYCYKLSFSTKKSALTARSIRVKAGLSQGAKDLYVYNCRKCRFWHMTKKPTRHG